MMLSLAGLGMAWIWFLSLIVVESIVLLFLIENDKPGWCTLTLGATFGLLKLLAGVNVFEMAWHNPGATALIILGYFAAGTAWSIAKWYFFVKDKRARYDEAKAEYALTPEYTYSTTRNKDGGREQEKQPVSWTNSGRYGSFIDRYTKTPAPSVRANKSRIMTWMGYWPWSMVWTLINDPIKRAFKAIYNRIHNMLQTISNNAFKGV